MSNLVVSTIIDELMQATTQADARTAIGAVGPAASISTVLKLPPVSKSSIIFNASSSLSNVFTERTSHVLSCDVIELQLVYPLGFFLYYNAETPNTCTPTTIKASIEVAGSLIPVTFNGMATGSCSPYGFLVSDPIAVDLPAGTVIATRTYTSTQGMFMSGTKAGVTTGGDADGFIVGSDVTTNGYVTTADSSGYQAPIVTGRPKTSVKSVVIIGDSISAAGNANDGGAWQWWHYGLDGGSGVAALSISTPGSFLSTRLNDKRWPVFVSGNTHAVLFLGSNDIYSGTLAETVEGYITTIVAMLKIRVGKVYICTIPPRTNSTDNWGTTINQSGVNSGYNTVRLVVNGWIRAGNGGADSYLDTADTVETVRDSGIWKVGYTGDGIHPNITGAQGMGSVLSDGTVFT